MADCRLGFAQPLCRAGHISFRHQYIKYAQQVQVEIVEIHVITMIHIHNLYLSSEFDS
ncbi:hypothetical protein D3C77_273400 [compost metagenome]